MSVRIISGSLRGRVIKSPVSDGTRPTTDMWRTSVFSALEHHIDLADTTVLDLCCGTGAFGFECISRGAKHVVFVDAQQKVCSAVSTAAIEFDVADKTEIHCMDLFEYLRTTQVAFDIIFADPPYPMKVCNKIAQILSTLHSPLSTLHSPLSTLHSPLSTGILVLEHSDSEALLPNEHLERIWYKERSQTVVEMYAKHAP